MKKKVFGLLLCGLLFSNSVLAVDLLNPSFEDPALDSGATVNGVTDWWDSASLYTKTIDEGDGSGNTPLTPYGENWAQLGNGRWIYQQIGTYSENATYEITFLLGQPTDKAVAGLHVELFAGGDPGLAADVNAKRDAATFPLTTVVGAVAIADSGDIDPAITGQYTKEMSVTLSTGTAGDGYAVGDPLWLIFSRPSVTGKALIDNVAVGAPTSASNPNPTDGQENVMLDTTLTWDSPESYTPVKEVLEIRPAVQEAAGFEPNWLDTANVYTLDPAVSPVDPDVDISELLWDYSNKYYWRITSYEPNTVPVPHTSLTWSFTLVPESPLIQVDPVAQLVEDGTEVTLSIDGLNFEDADVTWYHIPQGGTASPVGTAGKTLVLPTAGTSEEGQYYAVATNSGGTDTSAIAYVMTRRVVARYDFEGNLSDTNDSGKLMNDAAIIDPNVLDPNSPSVSIASGAGIVGSDALLLEDTDIAGYLEVPGSSGVTAFHSLGLTVSAWIKTETTAPYLATIATVRDNSTSEDDFFLNRYYARGRWRISTPTVVDSPTPPDGPDLADGQWHYLVGTYNADTQERSLYIDGISMGTLTGNVPDNFDSQAVLRIGGWYTNGAGETERPFLGFVDDVRVYSYSLTPEQVAGEYYDVTSEIVCYNPNFEGSYFDVAGGPLDTEGNPTPDCQVTLADFVEFANNWLNSGLYQP